MEAQPDPAAPTPAPAPAPARDTGDDDPFAPKLAGYYIAERGYRPGVPQAAAALAEASDIALTYADGQTLAMVFIVDGERQPGKRFTPTLAEVRAAQSACQALAGTAGGAKIGVSVHVVEVQSGPGPVPSERGPELAALTGERRNPITVSVVDPFTSAVWSVSRAEGRFIAGVLARPTLTVDDLRAATAVAEVPSARPTATLALLAVMTVVFGFELAFGVDARSAFLEPGIQTLIAFGGASRDLVVGDGEWFRLLSVMALHGSPMHLLFNGYALYIGGVLLESRLGRPHYLALFLLSGVGGALLSITLNPASLVSVGASGAISGLFGAAMVITRHYPPGPTRSMIGMTAVQILIPSLLPVLLAVFGANGHIDYAAHLGGALAGALYGGLLTLVWPRGRAWPGLAPLAGVVVALGLAGACVALKGGLETRAQFLLVASLPMGDDFAEKRKAAEAGGPPYVEQYPADPRGHILQAAMDYDAGRFAEAEASARRGLTDRVMLRRFFSEAIVSFGEAVLALAEDAQGRRDEALATARASCGDDSLRDLLNARDLCGPAPEKPAPDDAAAPK